MLASDAGKSFPTLDSDLGSSTRKSKRSICILTSDIFGPVKNGGIGSAYFHLAMHLSRQEHEVTVCFVNNRARDEQAMRAFRDFYQERNIDFIPLSPQPGAKTPMAGLMAPPYVAYEWLRKNEDKFDMVHVSEWHGLGYVCLLAKKLGIAFENIHFVVKGSSPTLWSAEGNMQFLTTEMELGFSYIERMSVEMADTLICGSRHLLEWMSEHGYAMPKRAFQWPNVFLPDLLRLTPSEVGRKVEHFDELVFFGRLEPRKGLYTFVNMLDVLAERGKLPKKITFLGGRSARFDSSKLINQHRQRWADAELQVFSHKDSLQAVEYLRGEGRLAIIPAVLENSPFAVYECLAAGIPLIAAGTGGTAELVDDRDKPGSICEADHHDLAAKVTDVLNNGLKPARPAIGFNDALDVWTGWHEKPVSKKKRLTKKSPEPLVSVCIAHHERPELLAQTITSIRAQTYKNIEIVVVDDGSKSDKAKNYLDKLEGEFTPGKGIVVRQDNRYLGAVRNAGARAAKGKYLILFDDDNIMMPNMVEALVEGAEHAKLDCLTCGAIRFSGMGIPPHGDIKLGTPIRFVGPSMAWGMIRNVIGDSAMLIKQSTFHAVGGFSEHYRVGKDDLEFFNKLMVGEYAISYYPDPLYYYRQSADTMKTGNISEERGFFRSSSPIIQRLHPDLAPLLMFRPEYQPAMSRNPRRKMQKGRERIWKSIYRNTLGRFKGKKRNGR